MNDADLNLALRKAAGRGSRRGVPRPLAAGADVNAASLTGRTALMAAARRRERAPDLIRLLVQHGAAVDAADRMGYTALHGAMRVGEPSAIAALLDAGANPDAADRYGHEPLWYAIQMRSTPLVTLLLDRGANPNLRARGDWPLLYWAMRKDTGGGDPALIRCMLDRGADPNILWSQSWTPLFAAVLEERVDLAQLLLEYGALVNPVIQGRRCNEPLNGAAMKQNPQLIRLLLEAGADPNLADSRGQLVPLCHAALGLNEECVKLLLAAGADPGWAFHDGQALVEIAREANRPQMEQLLREANAARNGEPV